METENSNIRVTDEEALELHASGRPGKIELVPTKPLTTQRDLSLAYSPGVAAPCLKIAENPDFAYDYTTKGNLVAVISNGTAVLGLGNLGALASKPVMEGKAVLFKKFADVDAIDLEVSTEDIDEFVNSVRFLGASFGGINLEDIRAPECFIIEQRLKEIMDIPVFHDDQHGTAIIAAAGFINALEVTGRDIKKTKVVFNGAGAAALACLELLKTMGLPHDNAIVCDKEGVIYQGRKKDMNQWKSAHAVDTKARSLADALKGADAFFGLSVKNVLSGKMVKSMNDKPIIFAMANPIPEIMPEEAREARPDAIIATGRSDYPNQVNNVLGFPYIFRGALDVRASTINDQMKIAAAHALANLAREDVPDEVKSAYSGRRLQFGPDYLIPVPFDPRLIATIPPAVAQAAMDSGVARKPIADMNQYRHNLSARLNPTAGYMQGISEQVRSNPQRVVFAEGEEESIIRAALNFQNAGYGKAILVGREDRIAETIKALRLQGGKDLEIHNARISDRQERYADFIYKRLQRKGALYRDCVRLVNRDRNIFASCMVASGEADAMITGMTRTYNVNFDEITTVIDSKKGKIPFGLTILITRGRTLFIADTTIHTTPTPKELADITIQTAEKARQMGHHPRAALLSFSNFGNPLREEGDRIREAVKILHNMKLDFEVDGELSADVALDGELLKLYPFCNLSGPANILVMPGLHSANIASNLLQTLGGGTVIGPLLVGLDKSAQIVRIGAKVSDIVNTALLAAHDAILNQE